MKILFITLNGIEQECFGGVKHSITNYNALNELADVDVYHIKKRSNIKSMQSLLEGHFPPALNNDKKTIIAKIKEKQYHLVFFDCSNFGTIVEEISFTGVPVVVYFQNCEADYIDVRFGGKKTMKSFLYKKRIEKEEKKAARSADYKIVLTNRDKERIEGLYNIRVDAVMPIVMEDSGCPEDTGDTEKQGYCLLLGPLVTANEEAFSWFKENISPYIKCQTVIAGKGFEKFKDAWNSEKVKVVGYVKDLSEIYRNACCVAIPLFSGAGMKVKTAEALMYGKYIFGTDEAFAGYDLEYRQVGGLCNTKEEFITKINQFLEQDNENYFNNYSRRQFKEKHSMKMRIKEMEKMLHTVPR